MRIFAFLIALTLPFLESLGASPEVSKKPLWITHPTRTSDAANIIFVGVGEDSTLEKAVFKAESLALSDVANECSFVPQGTKIAERYSEKSKASFRAFARIFINIQECTQAKRAVSPDAIKSLANLLLCEQVKKYQDQVYVTPMVDPTPSPIPTSESEEVTRENLLPRHIIDAEQLVITRQLVFLAKQDAIFGTVGADWLGRVTPIATQVDRYETMHKKRMKEIRPWSDFQRDKTIAFPAGVRRAGKLDERVVRPIAKPSKRKSSRAKLPPAAVD